MTDQQKQSLAPQRTMSQQRGEAAHNFVKAVLGKPYADKYLQAAKSAPADVQTNGLGQTLAFWKAKGKSDESDKNGNQHYAMLYKNLSTWLKTSKNVASPDKDFLDWIMEDASISEYRRATSEAISFLIWLRRFAEAEQV